MMVCALPGHACHLRLCYSKYHIVTKGGDHNNTPNTRKHAVCIITSNSLLSLSVSSGGYQKRVSLHHYIVRYWRQDRNELNPVKGLLVSIDNLTYSKF